MQLPEPLAWTTISPSPSNASRIIKAGRTRGNRSKYDEPTSVRTERLGPAPGRKAVVFGQRNDRRRGRLDLGNRISEEESVLSVSMNCHRAKSEKSSGSKSVPAERGPTTTTSSWSQAVCRRRAVAVVRMVSKESGETITTDSMVSFWLSVMALEADPRRARRGTAPLLHARIRHSSPCTIAAPFGV
jgi:hypothetical protein